MKERDLQSTLEILEKNNWGDAPSGSTTLVNRCHQLRRKVLSDFSTEDLRLMIGQQIGLSYLVPLALDQLQENILAEGDLFEGDLLTNVLAIGEQYWEENPDHLNKIIMVFQSSEERIRQELSGSILKKILKVTNV